MTDDQSAADKAFDKAVHMLAYALSQRLGIATSFSKALDAYHAEMPRALAVKTVVGIEPDAVSAPERLESFREWASEAFPYPHEIISIALVPVKDDTQ